MSILKNTRKRLFSFSKQGTLNEETEPRTADDSTFRRASAVSAKSVTSTGSDSAEEKRKPSSYDFLQVDNPLRTVWKEVETYAEDDDNDFDRYEMEKVCKNQQNGNMASCRIIYKFSEDAFDDYLVEIGLLNLRYPKFEDVMAEVN
jgi:hypothetical protein